jgi:hypothetical protein
MAMKQRKDNTKIASFKPSHKRCSRCHGTMETCQCHATKYSRATFLVAATRTTEQLAILGIDNWLSCDPIASRDSGPAAVSKRGEQVAG